MEPFQTSQDMTRLLKRASAHPQPGCQGERGRQLCKCSSSSFLSHTCIRKPYLLSVYHWPENATCLTDVENQMPTVGSGLGLDDSIRASERWWTMEKESLLSHKMPCLAVPDLKPIHHPTPFVLSSALQFRSLLLLKSKV
jgi:hypothetical protein